MSNRPSTEAGRVSVESDVVFGVGGGHDLLCDVYTPPGDATNRPAILLVHGGGWSGGDRTQLKGYGILVGRLGYVCVASQYRLSGESPWPAQLHDTKAALRWMRANATRLGINPDRIAVSGNSAGGHLSLMMAATQDDPAWEGAGGNPGFSTKVAASIAFYPPAQLDRGPLALSAAVKQLMGSAEGATSAAALAAASPVSHPATNFPPTLLIHGNGDELVPAGDSTTVYAMLAKARVPVELHMYAGLPHAFDSQPAYGRQSAEIMGFFLGRYMAEVGAAK